MADSRPGTDTAALREEAERHGRFIAGDGHPAFRVPSWDTIIELLDENDRLSVALEAARQRIQELEDGRATVAVAEDARKVAAYDAARAVVKIEGNTRAYYVLRAEKAEAELEAARQERDLALETVRLREESQIPMIPRGAQQRMERLEAELVAARQEAADARVGRDEQVAALRAFNRRANETIDANEAELAGLREERDQAKDNLRMLRDAWNAHFKDCPAPMLNVPAPTAEQIREWQDAPSDTMSALPDEDYTRRVFAAHCGETAGLKEGRDTAYVLERNESERLRKELRRYDEALQRFIDIDPYRKAHGITDDPQGSSPEVELARLRETVAALTAALEDIAAFDQGGGSIARAALARDRGDA